MNRFRTDFLFATPSFLSGAARALDLFTVYDAYNPSDSDEEADAKAILSDWAVVGQDILRAMDEFDHSHPADEVGGQEPLIDSDRYMSSSR